MTTPPSTPGRVVSITPLPKIEATEVELSNGIVIAFQRSTRRKEHIAFQGFALGGSSELSEYEETAFCMIDEVAGLSGLGELNGDALANLTSTWQTRVNTQRHTYHRGIGGSCPAAVSSTLTLARVDSRGSQTAHFPPALTPPTLPPTTSTA
mmetsp:Transcript_104113/g.299888  ORF Transcript_104113/g.299888 Transcript_104113/m.299888 type:complete len:152 (-) Transcript_104113:1980-2435(-)